MADIWIISDEKPGHVNQSLGLVEALLELKPNLTFKILPLNCVKRAFFAKERPKLIISAAGLHIYGIGCFLFVLGQKISS